MTPRVGFKILGKKWTIRLLTKKKYSNKNGSDSLAVTKIHKRRIDLSPKGQDLETILHELTHGYLSEMCLSSAAPTVEDLEEVFAELMAKRGKELISLAEDLRKRIGRLTRGARE